MSISVSSFLCLSCLRFVTWLFFFFPLFFFGFLPSFFPLLSSGYVPSNYSIVNSPVVKAVFLTGTQCRLNLTVPCKGTTSLSFSKLTRPFDTKTHAVGATLYINFADAMVNNGCVFFLDIFTDILALEPQISVFGTNIQNPDFGTLFGAAYGNLTAWQTAQRFFTMVNASGTAAIEAVLKEQRNVTMSITPCKSSFSLPSCRSPSQESSSVIGNWILYGQTPSFKAYQGVIAGSLVWCPNHAFFCHQLLNSLLTQWQVAFLVYFLISLGRLVYYKGFSISNLTTIYAFCALFCFFRTLDLTIDPFVIFNRLPLWVWYLFYWFGYLFGYIAYVRIGISW